MALFGSFNPVNIFKAIIKNPVKTLSAAVLTGGVSLVSPQVSKAVSPFTSSFYDPKLIPAAIGLATGNPAALVSLLPGARPTNVGAQPMALNVGNILGRASEIFGGSQNRYFQGVSNVAGLASQFFPQRTAQPMMRIIPPTAGASIIPRVGGVGGMIGRGFFNRYPALATVIQAWRNRGVHITRAKLHSLLKRFGPEVLITGGILTAAAVSELMMAGPGHRRMNAGNAKALHRSLRRLEAFHRLCVRADKFRGGRRVGRKTKTVGVSQFVRQG